MVVLAVCRRGILLHQVKGSEHTRVDAYLQSVFRPKLQGSTVGLRTSLLSDVGESQAEACKKKDQTEGREASHAARE